MKTTKSKLLVASLTLISIFFMTSSFVQHGTKNQYVTMRTWEVNDGAGKIVIVYEDGKSEEIILEKLHAKTFVANAIKINQAINGIANKGYELVTYGRGDYFTEYAFIKK